MSGSSIFASLGAVVHGFPFATNSSKVSVASERSNPLLAAFQSDLDSRVEQLSITGEKECLSIKWLSDALEMVHFTHASAAVFADDIQLDLTYSKWLEAVMENNVKLLDICLILKEAIADLKIYSEHVKSALRNIQKEVFGEAQIRRCMRALMKSMEPLKTKDNAANRIPHRRFKLESSISMLRRMHEGLDTEYSSKETLFVVIHAAQVVTIFICGLLTCALSSKMRRSFPSMSLAGRSPWSLGLANLQHKVKKEIDRKKCRGDNVLLEELDLTHIGVHNLYRIMQKFLQQNLPSDRKTQIMEIKESAMLLQAFLKDLQQGLSSLESYLDNIHKNLLKSRIAFLDMWSCPL